MDRLFTKVADGSDPNGRWFAGDVNALQDVVAALMDLTQNFGAAQYAIGESGLVLVKYGAGEARLTGAMRIDGILRGLSGLIAGTFTTTARNALGAGLAPFGLIILNTTTGAYEWNHGTDDARDWKPFGIDPAGDLALIGSASSLDLTSQAANNIFLSAKRAGDTTSRFTAREDGLLSWGPGGTGALDVTLSRSGAGVLKVGANAIVVATDARLTDARNPTVHAATHLPEGTDPAGWRYRRAMPVTIGDTGYVANTLTTILSKLIPGGLLGSDGILEMAIRGRYLNNTGGSRNIRIKAMLGTEVLYDSSVSGGLSNSSSERTFQLDLALSCQDSDTVVLDGSGRIGATSAPTEGLGTVGAGYLREWDISTDSPHSPVDVGADKTLLVQLAHDANGSANLMLVLDRVSLALAI